MVNKLQIKTKLFIFNIENDHDGNQIPEEVPGEVVGTPAVVHKEDIDPREAVDKDPVAFLEAVEVHPVVNILEVDTPFGGGTPGLLPREGAYWGAKEVEHCNRKVLVAEHLALRAVEVLEVAEVHLEAVAGYEVLILDELAVFGVWAVLVKLQGLFWQVVHLKMIKNRHKF